MEHFSSAICRSSDRVRQFPRKSINTKPWQRRRLRMRPGLTCIWVLEGRNHLEFNRWIQLDLAYIDTWSLWLDPKIFLRTIPIVLSGRGAYLDLWFRSPSLPGTRRVVYERA